MINDLFCPKIEEITSTWWVDTCVQLKWVHYQLPEPNPCGTWEKRRQGTSCLFCNLLRMHAQYLGEKNRQFQEASQLKPRMKIHFNKVLLTTKDIRKTLLLFLTFLLTVLNSGFIHPISKLLWNREFMSERTNVWTLHGGYLLLFYSYILMLSF